MTAIPIQEAAQRLGLTIVAVRKRAQRGTLAGYKRDGIWYIEVDDGPPNGPPMDRPQVDSGPEPITRELVDTLRDEIGFLRRELEARTQEVERAHILLQNTQRLIPANVQDGQYASERPGDDESRVFARNVAPEGAERVQQASEAPRRRGWVARLLGWE